MAPLITVLMPVYNAERFLSEAIDSILHQTFTDFEFLIIDDGSTDSSVAIIHSYNDHRVRLIQNSNNMGISASLNKGIGLARAELIARMDADDISYPERLQKQYDYLKLHPECALLSTAARVITEEKQAVYIDNTPAGHFYYNLTFASPIFHPTVMYRKNAVEEVGRYTVPYSEDFELFWLLSRKYKIHNLPDVLLDYRNSSQSLHQVSKKKEYDQAALNQTLRNIRYYAGDHLSISENCLRCLQYDVDPITKEKSINSVLKCFHQLELITERILETENINRDIKNIKSAARYKKRYTLSLITKHLPRSKGWLLLVRTGEFNLLMKKINYFLKRKLRA